MEDLEDTFFFPKEIFSFIGGLEPGGLLPFEEEDGTGAGNVTPAAAFFDLDFFGLLAFFGDDFFCFLLTAEVPLPPHFEQ